MKYGVWMVAILTLMSCSTHKMLPNGLRKMSSRALDREIRRYVKKHLADEDIKFLSTHKLIVEFDTAQKK